MSPFPCHFGRFLILSQAKECRLAQVIAPCPFREPDLADQLGIHPGAAFHLSKRESPAVRTGFFG